MAIHSSILAWRTLWTEEPGMLQSKGLQRVGHDLLNNNDTTLVPTVKSQEDSGFREDGREALGFGKRKVQSSKVRCINLRLEGSLDLEANRWASDRMWISETSLNLCLLTCYLHSGGSKRIFILIILRDQQGDLLNTTKGIHCRSRSRTQVSTLYPVVFHLDCVTTSNLTS